MSTIPPEPVWDYDANSKSYSRPLVASEAIHDGAAVMVDGLGEMTYGVTFTTKYSRDEVIARMKEALGALRFNAPLVAATIAGELGGRKWIYHCAASAADAAAWVEESFTVHTADVPGALKFALGKAETTLPYPIGPEKAQYFAAHLLCHSDYEYSFLFHATHSIFDGQVALDGLRFIMNAFSAAPDASGIDALEWGAEWKNLPAGILTAVGGPPKGWKDGVDSLIKEIDAVAANPQPSESLKPQREQVDRTGQVNVQRIVPADVVSKMLAALKPKGFSLTHLFEAAVAVTLFKRNSEDVSLPDRAHVTFDVTVVALQKFFVPPHSQKLRLASAMSIVPNVLPYSKLASLTSTADKLFAAMAVLKPQYDRWLNEPLLPFVAAYASGHASNSPYATVITNFGNIERTLPLKWPLGKDTPDVEVKALTAVPRSATAPRPYLLLWSLGGDLHLQIQGSLNWDEDYLAAFVEEVISVASSVIGA